MCGINLDMALFGIKMKIPKFQFLSSQIIGNKCTLIHGVSLHVSVSIKVVTVIDPDKEIL